MTRLLVSTITREVSSKLPSGHLYVVDLENLRILQRSDGIESPYREHDYNPRGGMRGLRGLSFNHAELAVANFSAVFFFDRHWNLVRSFTHPSVSAIHEILYVDDGVWVTSAANDLLAKFDGDGNLCNFVYLRSYKNLMFQLGGTMWTAMRESDILKGRRDFRIRTYFKSDPDDRTHLNSLALSPDGRLYLSLGLIVGDLFTILIDIKTAMIRLGLWNVFLSINRFLGRVFKLQKPMLSDLAIQPAKEKSAIVSRNPNGEWRIHLQLPVVQNPSHSIRILEDGTALYLNTSYGTLIHLDLQGNIVSSIKITENFLRGLLVLPNGQLVMGAGNTLVVFDKVTMKTIAELELSENIGVSIFDIKFLPDEFELPPDSLETKIGTIRGFDRSRIIWD